MVTFGDFNPSDEYFSFDGGLVSYGWRNLIRDYIDDIGIMDDIIDNPSVYSEYITV